ncbi:MAG TPA: hypothetical protein VHV56_06890 [Pseudolabrys sp.]|jgi:hypothetical protein|nr:hypothetical protein [Pseudolabrys sp.]
MFEVVSQIAKAYERQLEIEERCPEMPNGKNREDRAKIRLLYMADQDRIEWEAIGVTIEQMRKAH